MIEIIMFILSYLYGSIPFALVVGKVFYHKDIREYGSGNLGGTNAGRVLGKTAGVSVILLDASKAIVVVLLAKVFSDMFGLSTDVKYFCALSCVIGHCWPIFAGFKGGKAVASSCGYFLAINPIGAVLALVVFFIVLKVSKYVSLASVIATFSVLISTPFLSMSTTGKIINAIIILIVIYRHKANMMRIKNGTETKVKWL